MTRTHLILLATLGSAAAILGAWGFQYIGDMAPCKLCYWQRYPHMAAVVIGAAALILRARSLAWAGAGAALATAGIGLYHTGVERRWWEGPDTCTAGDVGGQSADALFDQIMTAPLVRCDEVVGEFLGLSMASWNALMSLGLVLIWVAAATRRSA